MRNLIVAAILLLCCDLGLTVDCVFDKREFNIGETFLNPGECAIYHCDAEGSISAKTCAKFVAPPNCVTIPHNDSLPYPNCCKRYECPMKR